MPGKTHIDDALIVSGDARIEALLGREDTVAVSAFACRLDGFVNDTFTEYANASVYRPGSVCRARLVSTLQDTTRFRGRHYFGFTMYTTAGQEEPVEMWIGHRQVALARIAEPDNRLHLFVAPERFDFKGGEPVKLVTAATTGPCRIEHLVFLPKKPKPAPVRLEILSPHVDVRRSPAGMSAAVTWLTNRPASGTLRWGAGRRLTQSVKIPEARVNHEVVLAGLREGASFRYEVALTNRATGTEATYTGTFRTGLRQPVSRRAVTRVPIELRRPRAGPWPVSVGVPFPEGTLGDASEVRLLAGRGREHPAQVTPLAWWPDGSVQWAELAFTADGTHGYRAEYGRGVTRVAAEEGLTVKDDRSGITVTTGPIHVRFDRARVRIPGEVAVRQADGGYRTIAGGGRETAVRLVDASGNVYTSGKPDSVALEAEGPEHACVRIDFRHRKGNGSLFRSRLRVHLFRGSGLVRVLHTFVNDRTEEAFTEIRSLSLHTGLRLGRDVEGKLNGRAVQPAKGRPVTLTQTHDNKFAVKQANRTVGKGRRANGTVDLAGSGGQASVSVRDFWQNYPKGLSVDADGVTLDVCPEIRKGDYPRGGELEDRLYYAILNGTYRLKAGVSRTHEMWLAFGPDAEDTKAFHASVQSPLLYCVSLDAFNRSGAVTRLPKKAPSPFAPYEDWVDAALAAYAADREASRAYGMLNFGDWFGERTYNWGNMEYDAPWCFLQEYVRGGDPQFYTWAEEAVRHLIDVDTCHASDRSTDVGSQYLHSVGHVGGYYPDGYRERAIFTGRSSVSHTWVEGLFLYHLLTGDPQALESAMATSDLLVGGVLNHYDFTNCRNCGWHLIHLSAAYRATGRRVYLNAARVIVDRVLERQRDTGGWDRLMVPGHCHCDPPRHTGNAGFMVGILMVGLKRYYEATGEKRVADAIVHAADYCIDTMWVPERSAFRYTCCPHSSVGGGADMRILKGVATAYRFSRKPRFRAVLEAGVQSAMGRSGPRAHRGVGKSICSPMRGAPQVLVDLPKGVRAPRAKDAKNARKSKSKAGSRKGAKTAKNGKSDA